MCTGPVDVCATEPVPESSLDDGSNNVSLVHSDFVPVLDTTRDALLEVAGQMRTHANTPTVPALRDAVDWYDDELTDRTNTTYGSPIQLWCQPNHIVLMTDGEPNNNTLSSYRDKSCDTPLVGSGGKCAKEIAEWSYTTDLRTGDNWKGKQNIVTHTIGFKTSTNTNAFMRDIATAGGGGFYTADTAEDLVNAFESVLAEAKSAINYTYTAPSIPMDASNAAVSGDKIYVPLLKPETKTLWKGNLKKYSVGTDADNNIVLKGSSDSAVLDNDFLFLNTARDLWGGVVDGADPLRGGAASKLTGTRNLYTYHGTSSATVLTAADNAVSASNTEITAAMLGAADAAERTAILTWAATGQGEMGAPLHTKPKVVTYSVGAQLVLLPSTDGMVHAFDASDGTEVWAYMPDELLPMLKTMKANADSASSPLYGLDGPGVVVHDDTDGDGQIDADESAYYVVGMRRGGRNYYALDISSRAAPKFAWEIIGGSGDFAKLGQTWSEPQIGKMTISGTATQVLIFGGGYDVDQDGVTGARTADDVGNAIYVVNSATGARLKWFSNIGADLDIAAMTNSIPANVMVIDVDADGLSDRIYAADVGGRILRIDLKATLSGGVIADINGGDPAGNRRFYNAPDVAYVSQGGERYLAIVIGSGFVPSPADSSAQDRFYMIKDANVFTPPTVNNVVAYTKLTEGNLYNATANLVQVGTAGADGTKAVAEAALAAGQGWYIDMASREKVFSRASVYDYIVLFSSYTVTEGSGVTGTDACDVSSVIGGGSIYAINLRDGSARFADMDGTPATLTTSDRSKILQVPGLPPEPIVLYPEGATGGTVVAIGGLEKIVTWPDRFRSLYWEEVLE